MPRERTESQKRFGKRLRSYRMRSGLTVVEAAELASLHGDSWYKYERGERWPSIPALQRIATAISTRPADLLD
jgi:transcriptional regulator with XRE-family HTH domain